MEEISFVSNKQIVHAFIAGGIIIDLRPKCYEASLKTENIRFADFIPVILLRGKL